MRRREVGGEMEGDQGERQKEIGREKQRGRER